MNCWEHVQYTYLIICCLLALLASSKTRSSCSRSYKCPLFKMQAVEVGSFLRRENREKSDTHHEKQGNQQIAATQPTWIDRACHTSKQWRNGSVNGVKANAFNALQVHWIQPQAMMSHNVTENQKARKIHNSSPAYKHTLHVEAVSIRQGTFFKCWCKPPWTCQMMCISNAASAFERHTVQSMDPSRSYWILSWHFVLACAIAPPNHPFSSGLGVAENPECQFGTSWYLSVITSTTSRPSWHSLHWHLKLRTSLLWARTLK